jgi:hypothetical protein
MKAMLIKWVIVVLCLCSTMMNIGCGGGGGGEGTSSTTTPPTTTAPKNYTTLDELTADMKTPEALGLGS